MTPTGGAGTALDIVEVDRKKSWASGGEGASPMVLGGLAVFAISAVAWLAVLNRSELHMRLGLASTMRR